MDVVAVRQCILVAVPAGLVQLLSRGFGSRERGRDVAGLAGHFKLVVSVGGGADKKHSPAAADDHQDDNDDHGYRVPAVHAIAKMTLRDTRWFSQ